MATENHIEEKPKERLPFNLSGGLTINLTNGTKIEIPENLDDSPIVISLGKGKVLIHNRNSLMFAEIEGEIVVIE